jgi:hypothetical protein
MRQLLLLIILTQFCNIKFNVMLILGLKLLQVSSFSPSVSQANILLNVHLLKAVDTIHVSLILLAGIRLENRLAN